MNRRNNMKAISIEPMYASAIALNYKTVELRTWKTNYRGDILICTTKSVPVTSDKDKYPLGKAIAIAELKDCIKYKPYLRSYCLADRFDNLSGMYCFLLDNIRPIRPIAIRGQQRVYNVPIEKEEIEILDLDSLNHPESLINYWLENSYIKISPLNSIKDVVYRSRSRW